MNAHWTDQLSAYLDGELSPADRGACEAHLATCGACRETLQELEHLAAEARGLGAVQPEQDLWPGIAARLPAGTRGRRRISFSLPELALAASLLMAVSAGVAWLAFTRGAAPDAVAVGGEAPIRAVSDAVPAAEGVQLANFADAQYDAAIADLERILLEERGRLDLRTVLVLERNLRTIDDAIAQARQALAEDPSNTFLNSHLADARQRKLQLLRRAAELAGN